MSLDDLLNVQISASTASPSKANFGTVLLLVQKVPVTFTQRTKLYAKGTDMVSDGFGSGDPAVLLANAIKAQSPSPVNFKVAFRLHKVVQTIVLTCTSTVAGDKYAITVNGTPIAYTVPGTGSPTTSTVATAIATLIAAVSGVAASTASGAIITTTGASGVLNAFAGWSANLQFQDNTADAGGSSGIADDLNAVSTFDNDWYGLALDSNSASEVAAAAAWVETNKKLFIPTTGDWGVKQSGVTSDIASTLKTSAYTRTAVWFKQDAVNDGFGAALMAKQFASAAPGSDSYAYKTVAGQAADTLSPAERAAILAKKANCYEQVNNVNITEGGNTASGQWLDVVRGIDWLSTEIQFRLYTMFLNNPKIPYTDLGVDAMLGVIKAVLQAAVDVGLLVDGSTFATAPKVATIDPATKASRVFPGIAFGGELQGAIHGATLNGTVTA